MKISKNTSQAIYNIHTATKEGVFFKISSITPKWERSFLSHITTNLLSKGYYKNDEIYIPNLLDLLNQAHEIVKKISNNFTISHNFFCKDIELPSGEPQKIFITQNEIGKYTIMLPEDY